VLISFAHELDIIFIFWEQRGREYVYSRNKLISGWLKSSKN